MAQIIAPESEFPVALLSRLSPVSNKVSQFSRLEFLGNLRLHHSYGKTPKEKKKNIYIYMYILMFKHAAYILVHFIGDLCSNNVAK